MQIRPLNEADLPLIRTWMLDTPEAPVWSDADLAGLLTMPSADQRRVRKVWIAEHGRSAKAGFAVATALCIPGAPAECELEFVLVPPETRRQGVGHLLVDTILAWARDLGASEIRLEVRESNAPALRLYEACGFVVEGRRPGYYADPAEDAVLMRRQLSDVPGDAPV
jgi:ribosomal-protein-alanine N-acetyltransferase